MEKREEIFGSETQDKFEDFEFLDQDSVLNNKTVHCPITTSLGNANYCEKPNIDFYRPRVEESIGLIFENPLESPSQSIFPNAEFPSIIESNNDPMMKVNFFKEPKKISNNTSQVTQTNPKYKKKPNVFSHFKTSKEGSLKLEYVRICLIRNFKRELRIKFGIQGGNRDLSAFSLNNEPNISFSEFEEHAKDNKGHLEKICKIECDPKTSWSNSYIQSYFSQESTKISFYLYLDSLFYSIECKKLQEVLNIKPIYHQEKASRIRSINKCIKCESAWKSIYDYFKYQMLSDIEIN